MESSCLQLKVSMFPTQLKVSVGEFCGAGVSYIPLLVDEGYLLIDFKDRQSFLFVKKK